MEGVAHLVHHDKHWEWCHDFDERVKFIKYNKPEAERELRLKLFFIVPEDRVPGRDSEEYKVLSKAGDARGNSRQPSASTQLIP